jgi:ADP-ribose pyrophosphatase
LDDTTEIIASGKFLRLVRRRRWEYADRINSSGAVVIVAVTDDRRIVLIQQYRLPLDREVIELPAGLAGDTPGGADESFAVAARRELLEETGYQCREMIELMTGPTSAGLSTEVVTLFRATGLTKVHAGGGTEHEQIEVHEVPLDEVLGWLRRKSDQGMLIDPKVYAGLYFAGHQFVD